MIDLLSRRLGVGRGLGLTLALLLNMKLRGINVWRTFYFVPAVLPVVAVSVLYYRSLRIP